MSESGVGVIQDNAFDNTVKIEETENERRIETKKISETTSYEPIRSRMQN